MKAVVYRRYGSPEVLRLEEVPDPVVKPGDVLVRVRAASLNPLDWHLLRGKPYIVRPTAGWRRPKRNIPGVDVAGVVEAVGSEVTQLKVGDEVFGEKTRACAEYVCGPERLFVPKPKNLTLEEAAAVPVGAITALQALRENANVERGQKVLINGASGGVGTFAVQLARHFGADVTAVCSTRNVELVRSLGADRVIDYTEENFTRGRERYDVIVDNVGNHGVSALRRALTATGALVGVGIDPTRGDWIAPLLRIASANVLARIGTRRLAFMLTDIEREDLLYMTELIEAGAVRPVIDRTYPLAEVPDAIRYLETFRARGKVVIRV
jgi:NADPH:quinone reductase-like Zn-dependent oxidoreductase